MMNATDLTVRTVEHNLSVDNAARYGWPRPTTSRDRRANTLGAVLGADGGGGTRARRFA